MSDPIPSATPISQKIAAAHAKGKPFIFGKAPVLKPKKKSDTPQDEEDDSTSEPKDTTGILCHKIMMAPDKEGYDFLLSLCRASGHVFAAYARQYNVRYKRMRESEEWRQAHALDTPQNIAAKREMRIIGRKMSRIRRQAAAISPEALKAAKPVIEALKKQKEKIASSMENQKPKKEKNKKKGRKRLTKEEKDAHKILKAQEKALAKEEKSARKLAFEHAYEHHGVGLAIASWLRGNRNGVYSEDLDILGPRSWIRSHLSTFNAGAIFKEAEAACKTARKEHASKVFIQRPPLRPCPSGRMGIAEGTIGINPDGSMFYIKRRGENTGKKGLSSRTISIPLRTRHEGDPYEEKVLSYIMSGCMRNVSVVPVRSHGKIHFELAVSYKGEALPDSLPHAQGKVGVDFGTQSTAVFGSHMGGRTIAHSPKGRRLDSLIKSLQRRFSRAQVANNPHAFDSNGAYIKGSKINRSQRMIALKRQIKALQEQQARCRKQEANLAGKHISRMGDHFVFEDCLMDGWSKAAGKGVRAGTPSAVRDALVRHAERAGGKISQVSTKEIKATQYDPLSGDYNKIPLTQRTVAVGGVRVDRDLKSAYVLSHVNNDQIDAVAARNEWQASCGQLQGRVDP